MTWVNALLQGILLGGLFSLFATGLSLCFGVMRFVNLAHGDLAILAAYITLSFSSTLHLNPLVSLFVVLPGAFLFGYILQRVVFDRVIGVDPAYQIVATFGVSIIIQSALLQRYTSDFRSLKVGSLATKSVTINKNIGLGVMPIITLASAIAVLGLLSLFLNRTKLGRAFRATSDDPEAARLMGIDNKKIYGVALAISLATVALAGVLLGARTSINPFIGPSRLIYAFESVIIGGLGSLWGTLAGGITLGIAQSLGREIAPQWGELVGHAVFLLVLATRPNGLFGKVQP
jgi:branched-chain amino acid transport system permease protein